MAETESTLLQSRMKRLFTEGFTVADIAEKLVFFDSKTTAKNRIKMKQAYETAMKLEYMFWDGIYRGGKWID